LKAIVNKLSSLNEIYVHYRYFISGAYQCDVNPIPTPFIKAAEMGNMKHVCIFMTGNDFEIDLYG
jgi:hypothetical protein